MDPSLPWLPEAQATTTISLVGPLVVPIGTSMVRMPAVVIIRTGEVKEAVMVAAHIHLKAAGLHPMVAVVCLALVELEVRVVVLVAMAAVVPTIRRLARTDLQVLAVDPIT